MEEGDVKEEDEDDEDGILFVTLESRFESKENGESAVRFGKIFNLGIY